MTMTSPDTNPEIISDASDDAAIGALTAEMEAAKQALADAAMRYAEAVQDATGTNPKVS
jgi:hypothetical protein